MRPLLINATRLALPALLLASASHAATFPDWGISMMDIRGVSPNPVMEVSTTNGQQYNQAADKQLVFKVEAKARCQNLHHVKYGQLLIYPNGASTISDNYANEVIIATPNLNKKTWANDWTPRTLTFFPNTTLKNQAIQACNTELNKRVSQGGNKVNIMKAGFETTMHKTTNQFNFKCGGPSPHANHPKSVENPHPVIVKCGTYTPPMPLIQAAEPPSFMLKGADISMPKTHYKGMCPAELAVKATITSNQAGGSFQYRFLEDGKAIGGWKQRAVAKGQGNTLLAHTINLKAPPVESPNGPQGFQGGIQNNNQGNAQIIPPMQQVPTRKVSIEVRRDNQKMSDIQVYQATCLEPVVGEALSGPGHSGEELPDLTSRAGITIGTKSSPWGGSLTLSKADAVSTDPRSCKFRFLYDAVNIGKVASGNTTHKLLKNTSVLHAANNFSVDKNQSRNVSGHIMLQPGHYAITASLDDTKTVTELKETNNVFQVTVSVNEDCRAPARNPAPAASQPAPPGTASPAHSGTPRPTPAARPSTSRVAPR